MAETTRQRLTLLLALSLSWAGPGLGGALPQQEEDTAAWDEAWDEDWEAGEEASPWHGFVELAAGTRVHGDAAVSRRATLGELRWRIEREWDIGPAQLTFRGDLLGDVVLEEFDADLRELAIAWRLGPADLKVGRQVLTWGTGDLVFLNDLFPKGWVSFFIGRDDEYLKAPSDAVRLTVYDARLNVDLVAMPRFNSDAFLSGDRLSFFSPAAGSTVAPRPPLWARDPSASPSNTEWALRLFRNVGSSELALYGFSGFYHQPAPAGPGGRLIFPELDALGASLRRPLGPGLFSVELSRHRSQDDRGGTDPRIPNSQARFLLGFEWEAARNLTVGFQYYLERTLDYRRLIAHSPWPGLEVDENRSWLTNRLTWRTRRDRVIWSLFTFYSATDHDAYLRPAVNWRISDAWTLAAGGNIFTGGERHTFFAQFEDNSNLYARARFSY